MSQDNDALYFIGSDDDGHYYVVPHARRVAWEAWVNDLDSDDEEAWDPPAFAQQVNPHGVLFKQPHYGTEDPKPMF